MTLIQVELQLISCNLWVMCANIFELSNIVNILHLTNINRFDQNSVEGIYNLILILATLKRVLLAVIRFI